MAAFTARYSILIACFLLLLGAPASSEAQPGGDTESPLATISRLFGPEKHPAPASQLRCGLEIADLVAQCWHELTPELKARIPNHFRPAPYRDPAAKSDQRVDICDAFLDSEHFRINYSTQAGDQPPGFPDLQSVRDLASHLETAYAYHRDVSGMGVALTDSAHGGGLDLIDCYYYNLSDAELFGYMAWGGRVETGCSNSAWGSIAVSSHMGGAGLSEQLQLTSEHEYYHLLQYAHNPWQSSWFMESTARNSEFHVWPQYALPRGAESWMRNPYYPLWDSSGFRRYAPHFWIFLEAQLGPDIVTQIWNRSCDESLWDILDSELANAGSDIDATFTEFAIWNFFAGWRDDGQHYDPAYQIPAVSYQAWYRGAYPIPPTHLAGRIAQTSGSNYVRFDGPAKQNDLRITIEGNPALNGHRSVTILGLHEWGHDRWALAPDLQGNVEFVVPNWGLYDGVMLVMSNFRSAPRDSAALHFTYAAEEVAADINPAAAPRLVSSAPNPFTQATRVVYFAPQSDSAVNIRVYDLAGKLVRTLLDERVYSGQHEVAWDGNDQNGHRVATGIYFVRLEDGPHQQTQKVMFIR